MKKSFFLTERKQEVKPEQASKGESGVLFSLWVTLQVEKNISSFYTSLDFESRTEPVGTLAPFWQVEGGGELTPYLLAWPVFVPQVAGKWRAESYRVGEAVSFFSAALGSFWCSD